MTKTINSSIENVIDSDYHEYAMYVLENRAIPSVTDGFKPVHRKLLYAMLHEHKGKKTKISDLGGISKYGYHHGEGSAMGAAVTLTAEYNNNVPLFQGHGSFGSRLIQEAAAPRYIYASLGEDFYKYFSDFEVCDKNSDVDNPEPQSYLPIIPWVLVNGIAVGFACKFMPHSPKDIAKACIDYLSGKKIRKLTPTFPQFTGTVKADEETVGKYYITGKVERVKRNIWLITEVPYGYDRETVFNNLSKMEEKNALVDFDDNCDKTGFKFLIKLNNEQDAQCEEDPISYFKLQKAVTENYTTLDETGKLKLFDNKEQIIKYFCDYRLMKVREKIDFDISKAEKEINWLTAKAAFVKDVSTNKLKLKDKKKAEWLVDLPTRYSCSSEDGEKLLSISVVDMTEDYISNLLNKITNLQNEYKELLLLDAKDVFLQRLKVLA